MRFKIDREKLLNLLQTVQGAVAVERRLPKPILSNLLLTVKDNTLAITATDLEAEIIAWTTINDVSQEGTTTVSARRMIDIARLSPENTPIDFALENDRLLIRFGRSRYNLSTLPADDFPTTSTITDQQTVQCPAAVLKQLLQLVQFSMAQEAARPALMGTLIELNPGKIKTVATDGHRLALAEHSLQCDVSEQHQITVPRKPITTLNRLLSNSDAMVNIDIGSNVARFNLDHAVLTSKLIDGAFPDYEDAIPDISTSNHKLNINREDLRTALNRISVMFGDANRSVRLSLAEEDTPLLSLSAEDIQAGDAQEELDVAYSGLPIQINFNVTYLIDILSTLSQETVELIFSDAYKGCLMRPQDSAGCLFVVMPIRT